MTQTRITSPRQPAPLPAASRFGLAVIAFGLLLDVVEHGLVGHAGEPIVAGMPLSEHATHLVVVVGMVLVLVGIVRTGMRLGRRPSTQDWSTSHAVR